MPPPNRIRAPLIVAHRALTPGATGNSLAAIRLAAMAGANLIELDIRLTLDRQPVVAHDPCLWKWAPLPVRIVPGTALCHIPVGGLHGHRIPPLRQALQAIPDGVEPALHLKERKALGPTLDAIARHGQPARTWLWLEHADDVRTARARFPDARVTLLRPAGWTPGNRAAYFAEAQVAGASGVSVPWGVIDADLTGLAHRHGLLVFSRQESFPDAPSRVAAGLDGIITTDPAAVLAALARGA